MQRGGKYNKKGEEKRVHEKKKDEGPTAGRGTKKKRKSKNKNEEVVT